MPWTGQPLDPTLPSSLANLLPADDAASRTLVAHAENEGDHLYIVEETVEESGGQYLISASAGGEARILLADSSVFPLDGRLISPEAKAALRVSYERAAADVETSEEGAPEMDLDALELETLLSSIRSLLAKRNHVGEEAQPDGQPATSTINSRILASAQRNDETLVTRNVGGTNHGRLACAWAVNEVVRQALGHPIGGELSTANMYDSLVHGRGRAVSEVNATPGSIIISPTSHGRTGHVGILGANSRIYSNSSSRGVFAHAYSLTSWKARYVGLLNLRVLFFDVVS
jgi:hypothetical protein